MATTMKLIAKTTLGSAASSITLGSGGTIPQTYTDLLMVASARANSNTGGFPDSNMRLTINGLTTSIYAFRRLYGTGSGAASDAFTGFAYAPTAAIPSNTATSNTFGNAEIYIPNYTASVNKSISVSGVMENNATASYIDAGAILVSTTAAITSVTLTCVHDFASGSSFFLYGITKA